MSKEITMQQAREMAMQVLRDAEIARLEEQLAEYDDIDTEVAELKDALVAKDAEIADQQRELSRIAVESSCKDVSIKRLTDEIERLKQEVAAWRALAPQPQYSEYDIEMGRMQPGSQVDCNGKKWFKSPESWE